MIIPNSALSIKRGSILRNANEGRGVAFSDVFDGSTSDGRGDTEFHDGVLGLWQWIHLSNETKRNTGLHIRHDTLSFDLLQIEIDQFML